jgi:transporter family protein
MWVVYTLLAAVFAALTTLFAKIGLEKVNSNLATAIRTVIVLVMAWAIVFIFGKHKELQDISLKCWIFLVLSGLATGLSWLCYYKAVQIGEVSKVAAVDKFSLVIVVILAALFLGETINTKTIVGVVLITAGMLLFLWK